MDWCCCVAVDLCSRVETYRSGTKFDYLPPAEVLDEGEGLGHVESEICSREHFVILKLAIEF